MYPPYIKDNKGPVFVFSLDIVGSIIQKVTLDIERNNNTQADIKRNMSEKLLKYEVIIAYDN